MDNLTAPKKTWLWLTLAVAAQFFILTGMYIKAAIPLWTGEEIRIKTVPVDPRSLFRGNYARLEYKISRIQQTHFEGQSHLRKGEVVYIGLEKGADGLYQFSHASLEKPEHGIFLRGRVSGYRYSKNISWVKIKYGIEAFFAPKKKALALEKQLRSSGIAVLMISDDGRARLKEVIGKE